MADESLVVRGINWRETFPFTQVFRAFRVAIHPTKIFLALALLLALYVGGRVLDALWPVEHKAVPAFTDPRGRSQAAEATEFERLSVEGNRDAFQKVRDDRRKAIVDWYAALLGPGGLKIENDAAKASNMARAGSGLGAVKDALRKLKDEQVKAAMERRDAAVKKADEDFANNTKNNPPAEKVDDEKHKRDAAKKQAADDFAAAEQRIAGEAFATYERARAIIGQGIFIQFFEYEVAQVNNIVWAVVGNDWFGGFLNNRANRASKGGEPLPGVFASITNFFVRGPWWLVSQHTVYFILFVVLFSIVWAIFGGAIARIAAVHVARDEKISLTGALRFSTGKFLSFIFAPIIPLVIVLVVGIVVAIGGLVGNIPYVGPILVGLLFFLALAAGFVMTLVLLGTAGGFNLMYPTIAVEGSDSFDAISRSFSYVYARPWRMLFYTLVAVVYGALCYLFVRFFLGIMLILTHYFVGWGMFADTGAGKSLDLWNMLWPPPQSHGLTYHIDTVNLDWGHSAAAHLLAFWIYLTAGVLGAFAISFYFSANTIIYYLMRREVDATELDDVYLEQTDEEFTEPAAAAAAGAAGTEPGTTTVVTPTTPAATPPADSPDQPTPPPAGG